MSLTLVVGSLSMRRTPVGPLALALCALSACAAPMAGPAGPPTVASADGTHAAVHDPAVGILVMAHGGTPEWNASVADAIAPLAADVPTALAYGMANPYTLAAALDSLDTEGVDRVAVVRLFLSGESFLDQTRYLLGMSDAPPASFVLMGPAAADPAAREPIRHGMVVATHEDGIMASREAAEVMADRARSLSRHPESESVMLLAHGMGDEEENRRVLEALDRIAGPLTSLGFAEVHTATLREDWEAQRVEAERHIRDWVAHQDEAGRRVLVLPARLSGFGPYAEVLTGLPYLAGEGLLPHEAIGRWVRSAANRVSCGAGWGPAAGECPTVAVDEDPRPGGP